MRTETKLLAVEQREVENEITGIKRQLYQRAMSHATGDELARLEVLKGRAAAIRLELTNRKKGTENET